MDNTALDLLTLFSERESLSMSDIALICNINSLSLGSPMRWMIDQGYIEKNCFDDEFPGDLIYMDCPYRITHAGKTALYEEINARKRFKYGEIRAWLSLAFAGIALIISIISIVMQVR